MSVGLSDRHVVPGATSGSRKRARSNDVNRMQMPRGRRKCGVCGEEGKYYDVLQFSRCRQVMLI